MDQRRILNRAPLRPVAVIALCVILSTLAVPRLFAQDPDDPPASPIIISEVLPNPDTDAATRDEWVELHNQHNRSIDLRNWFIADNDRIHKLPPLRLPPRAYVLVVPTNATVEVPDGGAIIFLDTTRIGSGLRNDGDRVTLRDPNGTLRDSVAWGDVRDAATIAPETGEAVYRLPGGRFALTGQPTPFAPPADGRHPGLRPPREPLPPPVNTMIHIAAVYANGDDDEWVLIENQSDTSFNTLYWNLIDNSDGDRFPRRTFEPGETMLIGIGRDFEPTDDTGSFDRYVPIRDGEIGGGLNRLGDRLLLTDRSGAWLAAASWGADRTFNADGRRIDPAPRGEVLRLPEPPAPWRLPPPLPPITITDLILRDDVVRRIALTNTTPDPITLSGWTATLGLYDMALPPRELAPGQTLRFATAEYFTDLPDALPITRFIVGFFLSDTKIELRDRDGLTIDAVPMSDAAGALPGLRVRTPDRPPAPNQSDPDAMPISVIIEQVLPNAGQGRNDYRHEWLLLRNRSDDPINLSGWTIADAQSADPLPAVTLNPGDTLLVAPSADAAASAPAADHVHTLEDGRIGNGLANSGDRLALIDPDEQIADSVAWGDHELASHPAPEPGQSIATRSSEPQSSDLSPVPEAVHAPIANVWISEVHPNSGAGDPQAEWFELANDDSEDVRLRGWSIADNTQSDPLPQIVIPAGGAIVIAASQIDAADAIIADGRIGNGLANSGDRLALIGPGDIVVDAVSWGRDTTHDEIVAPAVGISLHRAEGDAPPVVGQPSPAEIGAPAELAIPFPRGAVILTELMPDPADDQPEWVEIMNTTDAEIDLQGWSLADRVASTDLFGLIAPRQRIVFAALGDTPPPDDDARVLDRAIGNGLANSGDRLAIIDPSGAEIDAVSYGDADDAQGIPAPAKGSSIAFQQRWVVNESPSPGGDRVEPLLESLFAENAARSADADDRSPRPVLIAEEPDSGINPWLVVSAALAGILATLVVRRWRPPQPPAQPPPNQQPNQQQGPTPE